MELTVLIITYISLSITVGASSVIAIKQFSNLFFGFYIVNCCKKNNNKSNDVANSEIVQNSSKEENKEDNKSQKEGEKEKKKEKT